MYAQKTVNAARVQGSKWTWSVCFNVITQCSSGGNTLYNTGRLYFSSPFINWLCVPFKELLETPCVEHYPIKLVAFDCDDCPLYQTWFPICDVWVRSVHYFVDFFSGHGFFISLSVKFFLDFSPGSCLKYVFSYDIYALVQ